ncbi:MAG: NUDIX domain-containing protein [Alphaproteobacteria bacterium]|nr:NUDIX domain-containing protein [Alphaproteobacteria bacterium]
MTSVPPSPGPLVPSDAVGAILVTPDQRFLLQHRDDFPHIWYPGSWALFGGAIDPGENEDDALRRELHEELGFAVREAHVFTRFRFDFDFAGAGTCLRTVYEVPIRQADVATMRLGEGREMRLVPADEALRLTPMTGYDHFALYLYVHRARIRPRHARGNTRG